MRFRSPLAVGLVLLLAPPAFAQKAEADAAFQRGKALLAKGQIAEACAELETSMRLEPLSGTLYNLALCHDQLGKIATAWSEFRELSTTDRNAARAKDAGKRAAALEKRLTRMKIVAAAPAPGLTIERDGIDVTSFVGQDTPVDPARYTFVAKAPGRKPATVTADLTRSGLVEVAIPELAEDKTDVTPVDKATPPGRVSDDTPVPLDANAFRITQRPLAMPKNLVEVNAGARLTKSSDFEQEPIEALADARLGFGRIEASLFLAMHARYGYTSPDNDYRPSPVERLGARVSYVFSPTLVAGVSYDRRHPLGGTRDLGSDFRLFGRRKYVMSPKVAFVAGTGISYEQRDRSTNDSNPTFSEFAILGAGAVQLSLLERISLEASGELALNLGGELYRDTIQLTVGAGAYVALRSHMDVYVLAYIPTSKEAGYTHFLFGLAHRFP